MVAGWLAAAADCADLSASIASATPRVGAPKLEEAGEERAA